MSYSKDQHKILQVIYLSKFKTELETVNRLKGWKNKLVDCLCLLKCFYYCEQRFLSTILFGLPIKNSLWIILFSILSRVLESYSSPIKLLSFPVFVIFSVIAQFVKFLYEYAVAFWCLVIMSSFSTVCYISHCTFGL